ncbi:Odorant receptor [Gryllus bimaculatus]|nr:Odorant receptor [Gryllus bimaculatus]
MAEAEEEAPLAFPARLLDLLGVAVSGGAEGEGEGEGEGRGAGGRGVRLRFAFVCAMLAVETFAWIHHTMHAQRRYLLAVMSFTALPWLGPLDPRTGRPPAPLPLSLPVDDTRALGYYFNVASQVSQMLLFTLLIPTTDCTLAALMAHVALRLRGVAVALDQLRPRDGAAKGRDSGDGQWARRLRQCVSDHQVALGFKNKLFKKGSVVLFEKLLSIQIVYIVMMPVSGCTMVALMANAALQLRAVAASMRALGHAAWPRARERLRACVRHHQEALRCVCVCRLVDEVDALLQLPLATQFVCCSIMFCAMANQLTKVTAFEIFSFEFVKSQGYIKKFTKLILYNEGGTSLHAMIREGALLVPFVVQLFAYCYVGEGVREQGAAVAAAAWACGWEGGAAPLDVRKDLRMVLLRAQKPTRITALRIADVALHTFGETRVLNGDEIASLEVKEILKVMMKGSLMEYAVNNDGYNSDQDFIDVKTLTEIDNLFYFV